MLNIAMAVMGIVLLFYFLGGWVLLAFQPSLGASFLPKPDQGKYKNQIAMLIAVVANITLNGGHWQG